MKMTILSLMGITMLVMGSIAIAQTTGAEMTQNEGHGYGYGMMGGHMGGWFVYGLIKAVAVVIGLWLLHRIAKAVEKIAASKG